MTDDQIRIKIAEASFFIRQNDKYYHRPYWKDKRYPQSCMLTGLDTWGDQVSIPKYLSNLNAIRSAVISQDNRFQVQFAGELSNIASTRMICVHQLTARDWSNAFIKILGLKDVE